MNSAVARELVMTCHEMIQGAPDPDGNRLVLDGDVLSNHAFGSVTFLSSSKLAMLTPVGHKGVSTWAEHRVVGHKIYRTVYWKDRLGNTVQKFRQLYDFDTQTYRDLPHGRDDCHHDAG
jgi:hypothetical protein